MNTFFELLAEHETSEIPLEKICDKYFGLCSRRAKNHAAVQKLPVPAYRCGSQKSPWLISAKDLAKFVDNARDKALNDWEKINGRTLILTASLLICMYSTGSNFL